MALAVVLIAVSPSAAASYIMLVEHPERALFACTCPTPPGTTPMRWLSRQPRDAHVLADPGHAWKYGTSVRVAGRRDVFLEEVKDSAIAIYSRDVAARVVERTSAIGDFSALTADRARELAERYDLDYLVTAADLPLPEAYAKRSVPGRSSLSRHRLELRSVPLHTTVHRRPQADALRVGAAARVPAAARRRGALLRRRARCPRARALPLARRRRRAHPTLLLLHGLEGSSLAHYMRRHRRQGVGGRAGTSCGSISAIAAAPSICRAASITRA